MWLGERILALPASDLEQNGELCIQEYRVLRVGAAVRCVLRKVPKPQVCEAGFESHGPGENLPAHATFDLVSQVLTRRTVEIHHAGGCPGVASLG